MRNKFSISLLAFLLIAVTIHAQSGNKPIRIVDTLTTLEKNNRNPVLLKSELDSLIKQYTVSQLPVQKQEPVVQSRNDTPIYMLIILVLVIILLGWLLYLFNAHRKKFNKTVADLTRQLQYRELYSDSSVTSSDMAKETNSKSKISAQVLENKISNLNDELYKLKKENEGLSRILKEYNGIQHEFDSLKQGITKAYKIKNYPGYDKRKSDASVLYGVMETENSVANYAYEKFLKPILAITDANKNNPAKVNDEDREKLLELLVSLSLLYIEYLYLRVNDLAIGGKMVERIQGLSKGNGLDPSLLKKLNTENGSRALVLRMILDKTQLHQLSYPVFDETDLNNQ